MRGAHFTWHQVEDATPGILMILDVEDVRVVDDGVAEAWHSGRIPYPVRAIRRDLVPASQEQWLATTPRWAPPPRAGTF